MTDVSHEFSRRALDLSLAVYRITASFPSGEVLIGQLRQLSNEIAGDLEAAALSAASAALSAAGELAVVNKKIDRLQIYFKIAQAQNWVRPINWQILDFEYYKLAQEVNLELRVGEERKKEEPAGIMSHNIRESVKPVVRKPAPLGASQLNSRQGKILAALEKRDSLKMSDLIPLFKNDISERTLRNELQLMVKGGLIKKSGTNKTTAYFKP